MSRLRRNPWVERSYPYSLVADSRGPVPKMRQADSARYLLVEISGAAAAGLLAWRWGLSAALPAGLAAVFGLFLNALTDLEDGYVFDVFTIAMGGCGLFLRLLPGGGSLLDGLLGGVAGFAVIALIIFLSRGMGWGDATLAAGTGMIVGWKFILLTLYLGFMAGAVFCASPGGRQN